MREVDVLPLTTILRRMQTVAPGSLTLIVLTEEGCHLSSTAEHPSVPGQIPGSQQGSQGLKAPPPFYWEPAANQLWEQRLLGWCVSSSRQNRAEPLRTS